MRPTDGLYGQRPEGAVPPARSQTLRVALNEVVNADHTRAHPHAEKQSIRSVEVKLPEFVSAELYLRRALLLAAVSDAGRGLIGLCIF